MIETTKAGRALYWREFAKRMERWARKDPSNEHLREAARIAREGANHYAAEAER